MILGMVNRKTFQKLKFTKPEPIFEKKPCLKKGVGYFPSIFLRATSQVTIYQVATFQKSNLPSGNFPKVRFSPLRRRRLEHDGKAERCGQNILGKLPLGKLHIWEVASWENTLESCHLGNILWERTQHQKKSSELAEVQSKSVYKTNVHK